MIKERLSKNNMKENIRVELKESRLDQDMIFFFRMLHACPEDSLTSASELPISLSNEAATLNSILLVCTKEQTKFETTLEQDCELYQQCSDYRMVQVLRYRVGKKRILASQCQMAREILDSLEKRTPLPKYEAPFMAQYLETLLEYC